MLITTIALMTLSLGQSKADLNKMLTGQMGPTEAHKRLEILAGQFDHTLSIAMVPGSKPMEIKSDAVGKWVVQGRFLELATTPAKGEELRFESRALLGYDTIRKKYTAFLLDSFGTYSVSAEGVWEDDSKSFVLIGKAESGAGQGFGFRLTITPKTDQVLWSVSAQKPGTDGSKPEHWSSFGTTTLKRKSRS
ncbi:MAG: DUF1579 family protein [Chlorobia bacterium]|nr:DUF1579 family protein [Fimbriimonadaceae bacterium]